MGRRAPRLAGLVDAVADDDAVEADEVWLLDRVGDEARVLVNQLQPAVRVGVGVRVRVGVRVGGLGLGLGLGQGQGVGFAPDLGDDVVLVALEPLKLVLEPLQHARGTRGGWVGQARVSNSSSEWCVHTRCVAWAWGRCVHTRWVQLSGVG